MVFRSGLQPMIADFAPPTTANRRFDTLVLGLGKTGLSCVRHLAKQGETVAVADDSDAPPALEALREQHPEAPVFLGESFDEALLRRAGRVVVSPGVPGSHPTIWNAKALGLEVIGDVELFCRNAPAPLIAVTGSNGKSTVVSLLAAMFQRAGRRAGLGGNIGAPALDLLEQPMPDCYVLELSSFQLEILHSHRPVAATVLNISADHLDRHGDVREYAMAKERIYAGGGAMIINLDDERTRRMSQAGRETITFSLNRPEADFTRRRHDGETWLAQGPSLLLRQSELKLRGAHNATNALACLALGHAAGLPMAAMVETLRRFEGLPHRCEWVATHNGVEWFNDSKATNVGATVAALRGFADGQKRVRLIAGGDGKGADFSALAQSLEAHVRSVALIGKSAPRIAAVVAERERVSYAATMQAAVDATMEQARPGDIALLSPACASFDMFENYEDRGNAFKRCLARALAKAEGSG